MSKHQAQGTQIQALFSHNSGMNFYSNYKTYCASTQDQKAFNKNYSTKSYHIFFKYTKEPINI